MSDSDSDRDTAGAAPTAALAPTLSRMVDALAWPLLLIDASAGLHHANLAARQLLARGQPLRLDPRNRVQPAERAQREPFSLALAGAARGQAGVLRWPSPAGVVMARLQRLPPEQSEPAMLLLALSASAAAAQPIDDFAKAHDLTGTESRVLQHLSQGLSAPRVAQALGVAVSTARSHIVALRRKTGHRSVAALLHSLAQLPPAPGALPEGK